MSYWAATVIINLLSAIPILGKSIVVYLWGNYSVSQPTLNRFLSLHYLLPFIIAALVVVHLLLLHRDRSTNPLRIRGDTNRVTFSWRYISKDLLRILWLTLAMEVVVFFYPWALAEPQNFIKANPLVTPHHIRPEWYFLFAYAILRSIPHKLGGVIRLFGSLLVL